MSDDGAAGTESTPAAISALVASHREFLAFVERRVRDKSLAEDLVQEAFAKSLSTVDTVENPESIRAWFYRSLRNAIVDHHRRDASLGRKLDALTRELDGAEFLTEVDRVACQCVTKLTALLKPEYAEALRKIELDGLSVKDYAERAGVTANNAAVRVFRARAALREQLKRACGTCADHGCLDCTCDHSRMHCCKT